MIKSTACKIGIREIVTLFMEKQSLGDVASYVQKKLNISEGEVFEKSLKKSLRLLKSKFDTRYAKSHRMKDLFYRNNSKWLDSNFEALNAIPRKSLGGRPKKSFSDKSQRSRLRQSKNLREIYSTEELISATASALRNDGYRSVAWIVEHLFDFPEKASRLKDIAQSNTEHDVERFTVDDALRFLCENDFTKQQYQNIRNMILSKGVDIFPPYNDIRDNKVTCYPRGKN